MRRKGKVERDKERVRPWKEDRVSVIRYESQERSQ